MSEGKEWEILFKKDIRVLLYVLMVLIIVLLFLWLGRNLPHALGILFVGVFFSLDIQVERGLR